MNYTEEAIQLLSRLISLESYSRKEHLTADALMEFFQTREVTANRFKNNVKASNRWFDPGKPTILLNSHHDTVLPNAGYTRNPFEPVIEDGKLYGLGSNDAGGALVCLLFCFLHFYDRRDLTHNLLFTATGEEEISGAGGIESFLPQLGPIAFGIVGEPTGMQPAIAEKGLMVLNCVAHGKAGHAARDEGENALYKVLPDIEWFRTFRFPKASASLGSLKMTVTMIEAGKQHNVVPDTCRFTVDIRTTDAYTNDELLAIIRENVSCEVKPRSMRLAPSSIDPDHLLVKAAVALGKQPYGSPTLSDQALMPFPTLKMGPGDSARSHTADEFIYVRELKEGIDLYIKMLESVCAQPHSNNN